MRLPHVILAASAATLALPAAAGAATKPVYAGPPVAKAQNLAPDAVGNAFYPRTIKVRQGDKVAFKIGGFHDVVFAAKGQKLPAFHVPDPAKPVAGATDANGAAYWFNGQPGWFIDPVNVLPTGDGVIDGKAVDGSGVFQGQGAPPDYVATFSKKGTYRYVCTIHPGMKGKVQVVSKHAKAPSKKQDAKTVDKQIGRTVKLAAKLDAEQITGNVVRAGNDRKEVAFLRFFPGERTVKAGETVSFQMSKRTTEIHNVVFGTPELTADAASRFIAIGANGIGYDPFSVYPSDQGTIAYDGTNHGNGLINLGLMDADPTTSLPASEQVTFPTAGTYTFICTVHGPSMHGTIRVV
jgi:plastocyanin